MLNDNISSRAHKRGNFTISEIAKIFNLSRSTLLYYDKKNILTPSGRSPNNYRCYNQNDYEKLKIICSLREVGLSLEKIKDVLQNHNSHFARILQQRLLELNEEISNIRNCQRLIITLLGDATLLSKTRTINKDAWTQLLRAAGLDDNGMKKWHQEFENSAPEAHQDFLESLGLNNTEIKKIRTWSSS
jgi:DNA-binding transcriptional MerR regulator